MGRRIPAAATSLLLACLVAAPAAAAAAPANEPEVVGGQRLSAEGIVVDRRKGAPKLPKTRKLGSFVIADADTGEILAARDPHGHYRPASTIKMLTALTLIPALDKDKEIKPSKKACNTEGSAVGLKPTLKYKIGDLFTGLMLSSGNDAAVALAEANGGVPKTLDEMNAQARHLRAHDTIARTPNGLDKKDQRSSAYDLALIARAGLRDKAFRKYISTKTTRFPAPKGKTYQIQNHNKLLYNYRGALGVKNGYTEKARATFVGAAKRGGRTLILSVMKYENPPFWEDVTRLLDWGFAAHDKVTPVGELVEPGEPEKEPQAGDDDPAPLPGVATNTSSVPDRALIAAAVTGGLGLLGIALLWHRSRRQRQW